MCWLSRICQSRLIYLYDNICVLVISTTCSRSFLFMKRKEPSVFDLGLTTEICMMLHPKRKIKGFKPTHTVNSFLNCADAYCPVTRASVSYRATFCNTKRRKAFKSPLLAIRFWRIRNSMNFDVVNISTLTVSESHFHYFINFSLKEYRSVFTNELIWLFEIVLKWTISVSKMKQGCSRGGGTISLFEILKIKKKFLI